MTAESLQAWLIHKTPTGDTSLKLRLFTREKGLLDCQYRGGRTIKKNATLQLFTPLWLFLKERHHWFYVNNVESSESPLDLSGSSLFAALYVNELIFHTMPLQERDEPLFVTYQNTLRVLATTQHPSDIEINLRRFEINLLTACGYSLSFSTELNSSERIKPTSYYQFIAGHGFKESNTGIPGQHLLALADDHFKELPLLKTAKGIMRQAIDHLLGGRQLKTRSLYVTQTKVHHVE